MNWKRWAVVIGGGFLALKAPHTTEGAVHNVWEFLVTSWHSFNLH